MLRRRRRHRTGLVAAPARRPEAESLIAPTAAAATAAMAAAAAAAMAAAAAAAVATEVAADEVADVVSCHLSMGGAGCHLPDVLPAWQVRVMAPPLTPSLSAMAR